MKSLFLLSSIVLSSFSMKSCEQSYDEAKAVVDEFVQAMYKPVNFKTMKSLYVDFPFMSVARAEAHEIKSMKQEGNAVIADVHSYWTKSDGQVISNDFLLKLEKREGQWKIVNSKNLSNIKGLYPYGYEYGIANGMFKESDGLWDVELLAIVKKAKKELGD
jgi:hypothetical protein